VQSTALELSRLIRSTFLNRPHTIKKANGFDENEKISFAPNRYHSGLYSFHYQFCIRLTVLSIRFENLF